MHWEEKEFTIGDFYTREILELIVECGEIQWINGLLIQQLREHYFTFGILPQRLHVETD